jgi:hypothetical protein
MGAQGISQVDDLGIGQLADFYSRGNGRPLLVSETQKTARVRYLAVFMSRFRSGP